ncbi:MAG: hypothetical protein JWM68_2596 [Verrucomicrobiales bacterium]|nr:hypothetical protein [Verrucomicrobiales bacterium]
MSKIPLRTNVSGRVGVLPAEAGTPNHRASPYQMLSIRLLTEGFDGAQDGGGTILDAELGEDVFHMFLHGGNTHLQD